MIDMREASAMTEASGLMNDEVTERASEASWLSIDSRSQEAALRWAGRLRKVTVKAPLPSLFAAFLLAVWVARRL